MWWCKRLLIICAVEYLLRTFSIFEYFYLILQKIRKVLLMLITATNKNSESAYGEGKRGGRHTCSCKENSHLLMLVGQTKVLRGFVLSIQPFRLSIQPGFSLLPYVLMIELILTSLGLPLVGFYSATFWLRQEPKERECTCVCASVRVIFFN